MSYSECTVEQLLGPLNEVERKFAPKKLFTAGHLEILKEGARVSIVGSRKATQAGLARARKLAGLLCRRGVVVVSGLASGIDTAAHTSAIDCGGHTIAVLGTPLDQVYPKENASLQDRIMREQLCVSQYPKNYPVRKGSFPMRNRTMALISDVTVIIEAGNTSGSLSQGWEALRLGRGLFIAKSITENPTVTWPAEMLSYGARILSDDSLDELFDFLPERTQAVEYDAVPF